MSGLMFGYVHMFNKAKAGPQWILIPLRPSGSQGKSMMNDVEKTRRLSVFSYSASLDTECLRIPRFCLFVYPRRLLQRCSLPPPESSCQTQPPCAAQHVLPGRGRSLGFPKLNGSLYSATLQQVRTRSNAPPLSQPSRLATIAVRPINLPSADSGPRPRRLPFV